MNKDHRLWNHRADDTGSIRSADVFSRFIRFAAERRLLSDASRQNQSTYYRSCVYVLSAFSTLRRNHHWVIGKYSVTVTVTVTVTVVTVSPAGHETTPRDSHSTVTVTVTVYLF